MLSISLVPSVPKGSPTLTSTSGSFMAVMEADIRSAANSVPSGANVSGPMLVNEGPTAGVTPAESGADTEAMASRNTVTSFAKVRMCGSSEGEVGTLDYGMAGH